MGRARGRPSHGGSDRPPAASAGRTSRSPSSGSVARPSVSCSCASPSATRARGDRRPRGTAASATSTPRRGTAAGCPSCAAAPALRDRPRERVRLLDQGRADAQAVGGRRLRPRAVAGWPPQRGHLRLLVRRDHALGRAAAGCGSASRASTSPSSTTSIACTSTRPTFEGHLRDLAESGWKALDELRSSGQIGAVGAGINERGLITRHLAIGDIDAFLIAMPYTLLHQEVLDDEFPAAVERGCRLRHRRAVPVRDPGQGGRGRRQLQLRAGAARDRGQGGGHPGRLRAARRPAGGGVAPVPARPSARSPRSSRAPRRRPSRSATSRRSTTRSRPTCGPSSRPRACSAPTPRCPS